MITTFTRRNTRGPAPTDTPGLFYLDFNKMLIFRDTGLGPDYTAAAILRRCGLDKTLPELARGQQLQLKPGERALLDNPDLDNPQTRDLLLRLSVQHDRLVTAQEQTLRHTHSHRQRYGHSL